jgi:hypothetical protein
LSDDASENTWLLGRAPTAGVTITNPAEPNNTNGALGPGEDCGMMRSDGTWSDGSCSSTSGYVCEVY